ncbi:sulfotransferase family protein [Marinicella rhabdoformis]|uniref:sulfotransferase family protein n=1 Tax=Marinicella rhabdoformis TaxID=2580566 RepID=UPI0012AEB7E7|nr:sulfotransferase [Marinicella rhabdoformis]
MKDNYINEAPILFIVGLQKSGTTLLNRLISSVDGTIDPFKPEGRFFWGDFPPFNPELPPCGELFQKSKGLYGHHLTSLDYLPQHKEILIKKINEITDHYKLLINKNPYNSVRIDWLKAIFPNCNIIGIIRNPVSNIYSLQKKFSLHENSGFPPENNWWGVKPKHWKSLINKSDLIKQLSLQWKAINLEILKNKSHISALIDYKHLCSEPELTLNNILDKYNLEFDLNGIKINHQDNEFKTGSRLLSKNKEFNHSGFTLELTEQPIESPPFNNQNISEIDQICGPLWSQIKSEFMCKSSDLI